MADRVKNAIEISIRVEAKKNFPEGWGAYFALEMTLFYHLTLKWKSYDLLPSKPAAVASQVRRAASARREPPFQQTIDL